MPYSYHVEFDMTPDGIEYLEVGRELETIAATLKSVLPGEPGLVTSRTIYSLDREDYIHVIFESLWEDWDDLVRHRQGELDEYKYITRWAPPLLVKGVVSARIYGQAGI
jgi:hypothetical protein